MKALTVCQPWAWLIANGHKAIENRSWPTDYRGPLLIHAGKSERFMESYDPFDYDPPGPVVPPEALVFGAFIALADLVDCHPIAFHAGGDPFAEGPECFVLDNVRRFHTPIPWKGKQGLWEVPVHVVSAAIVNL